MTGKKALADVHKSYVLLSADKSENTIVVCKRYYVETKTGVGSRRHRQEHLQTADRERRRSD